MVSEHLTISRPDCELVDRRDAVEAVETVLVLRERNLPAALVGVVTRRGVPARIGVDVREDGVGARRGVVALAVDAGAEAGGVIVNGVANTGASAAVGIPAVVGKERARRRGR